MKRDLDRKTGIGTLVEELEGDLGAILRAMRKGLDAAVAEGQPTSPQMNVMRVVVKHGGISLKDLSAAVSLAHSTVSGIVDRLESRGMIERRADAADGRVTLICPTPVVKEFVRDQIPALVRRPLAAALERASHTDRAAIVHAVRRLRKLLEEG